MGWVRAIPVSDSRFKIGDDQPTPPQQNAGGVFLIGWTKRGEHATPWIILRLDPDGKLVFTDCFEDTRSGLAISQEDRNPVPILSRVIPPPSPTNFAVAFNPFG